MDQSTQTTEAAAAALRVIQDSITRSVLSRLEAVLLELVGGARPRRRGLLRAVHSGLL